MRTARPDRFAMKRLRGDLPAASALAALLLVAQLLMSGLTAGAAQAGAAERHLCTATQGGRDAGRGHSEHGAACLCLAAGCCAAPADGAPPADAPGPFARSRPVFVVGGLQPPAEPERRPLRLFARAGRGPPHGG